MPVRAGASESACSAAMAELSDQLSEIIPTLDAMKAWRLGMAVGNMFLAAHAAGRLEALMESGTARQPSGGDHG